MLGLRPLEKQYDQQEIVELLKAAKAREPWSNPDLCQRAARVLTTMRHLVDTGKSRPAWKSPDMRAWEAACEMRACIPAMKAQFDFPFASECTPDGAIEQINRLREEKLRQLDAISTSLDAYFASRPSAGATLEGTWQENAAELFQWFRLIVGRGAVSKNSPAVRFVQAALVSIGRGKKELGTIEQALRRFGGL